MVDVMSRAYDPKFIRYAASSSRYSASRVISLVLPALDIGSVLDIGCAGGGWLKEWKQAGIGELLGVDGAYVNAADLEIEPEHFVPQDLSHPFDLGKTFDLVQSFEVAEHIDESASDVFVSNVAKHARRYILFSAAVPGQGGEHHVNEQPYDFWRRRFAKHGFVAYDFVRPRIAHDNRISFWYRYNILLFVKDSDTADLAPVVSATKIPDNLLVPDISSRWFKLRKNVVKSLSAKNRDRLARLKARVAPTGRF
jgi:SAM-dependent methyltransferase